MSISKPQKVEAGPDNQTAHSSHRSRIMRGIVIGAIIGALLTFLAGDFERRTMFDTWQIVSPRQITADNVVVVEVDDYSIEEAGQWPWPRYVTAQLIDQIGAAQPRAIGIDVYFTEPDPLSPQNFADRYLEEELDSETRETIRALPDMDQYLGIILGQTPSVLGRVVTNDQGETADQYFFNPEVSGTPPPQILTGDRVVASIFTLDEVAMGHGMLNGEPDTDGLVRRVPLATKVGEVQAAGFAAELARIAMDVPQLEWSAGGLTFGDKTVPTDDGANMRFRMGTLPEEAKISALEVLNQEVSADVFKDKVVIIGVIATGTYDIVGTPLNSEAFGVHVQAQAVDAILENAWVSRPAYMTAVEIGLAVLLVILIIVGANASRNWPFWLAFGVAVALPFGSWLGYTQGNVLFDPARPLLVAACAAIALAITRFAVARSERKRLADELVEERVRASEQKGELEAARRIQMSMVPGEKTLSRLDHRTEIGAVLEPAKSVGGDFFDAVKINEHLLLFMVGDVTGKGVPAALFMALSKTLSKSNLARAGDGLAEAVEALNRDLMDEADDEMGLTMLVGTVDCRTGATQLINAGHENPMVVRQDKDGNDTVDTFEMKGGPPFCVIEFPYQVESIDLNEGDTLIVITDGATEAANEADQLFGMSGVLASLTARNDGSAKGRASKLAKEVRLFEGSNDPTDDLTIFALRYLGEKDQ
ncbi:CHASE2 domain-containing protein [Erythrobacter sp. Alg231-14]|uniref:CHASE2 domain-containing protein n=1 Tax=Erythrobacter sp. Alg231-14 TaxID=1922225 RepID=UPI00307BDA86